MTQNTTIRDAMSAAAVEPRDPFAPQPPPPLPASRSEYEAMIRRYHEENIRLRRLVAKYRTLCDEVQF